MGKLTDDVVLDYLRTRKMVYDSKKEVTFIVDSTNANSLNFFRGFGDADTDEYIGELIYKEFGMFPSDALLKRIIKVLAYETKKNGLHQYVNYRVANTDKGIYVNIGAGLIVRVTRKKVSIAKKASVKFVVHNTLGKMVSPDIDNGDFKILKKLKFPNFSRT